MLYHLLPTDSITAVMSGAANTTNPTYAAQWDDGPLHDEAGSLSGATAVTLIPAPASGSRGVRYVQIYNADDATVTVTVSHVRSGTSRTIAKVALLTLYHLRIDENGIQVWDSSGQSAAAGVPSQLVGVTAGTITASKAVVVDSNKDASAFRNVTLTNLDAGASGTAGTVDVFPTTAAKGKLAISCTDQTGDTTVSLVAGAMAGATTVTLRDPGAAASILTTTDGTAAATAATAVEITRACDMSTRIVDATASTLAVTEADHDGKVIVLDLAAGIAVTLPTPAAGMRFEFIVKTTFTGAASIKSGAGTHVMIGHALMGNNTDNTVVLWQATAADTFDTIDLLGTANSTGGIAGQRIVITGLSTTRWHVEITGDAAGTEATPFADTVA